MKAKFGEETVWFNAAGITNILSFSLCKTAGYIMGYNDEDDEFVLSGKGLMMAFRRTPEGLYAHDLSAGVSLLSTIEDNKKKFTKRQVAGADRAKKLYETIGFPSLRDFDNIIFMNGIKNSPVSLEDIRVMKEIYGDYNVFALKGKTKRKKPQAVRQRPYQCT